MTFACNTMFNSEGTIPHPMKLGILVDFDGTIASTDASYAILDKYADKFWYEIEKRAYAHEITILEAIKEQTKLIRCSP